MKEEFYQKLKGILKENQILIDEPLAKHTTFQIGGPAQFILLPHSISDVIACVKLCHEDNMPFYVLGNGSNLLVSDKGYGGTVIKIGQSFSEITAARESEEADTKEYQEKKFTVCAQAGVLLSKLANEVARYGLKGFEFAAGIPGTLGGAVAMNAGAYGGEMKDYIVGAKVIDQEGNILDLGLEELKFGYRTSIIQDNNYIVLEATFSFLPGNIDEIREKINDLNSRRREKQPLEYPSAGSTFKRPEGNYAGKLIMDSGLSGYQVGMAQVSEKHCGFVINKGGATATDVITLISEVIQIVYYKYGIKLEPEVKLLGDF
jgi:UDP-N-acetylmuramate dehydrogenase